MKKPLYKNKILLFSIAPLVVVLAYFLFFRDTGAVNVLVFSKTEQFRHESIEAGIAAIQQMGRQEGFFVEATEDASAFTESNLRRFNVVVFLNTTGDVLDEGQQIELRRFIQAGGGFVGIHAAADTEYEWPWYNELVGAWFRTHPNNPNVREARLQVVEAGHASTAHLPAEFTRTDEWYDYRDFHAGEVNVLINIDESSYKRPEEDISPAPRPIAWYREFEGGRTFYTGFGHTEESYSEPAFLKHLLGGIRYAAGPGQPVDYNNATVAPEASRFRQSVYAQGLEEPMELDLLPDGRILFVERRGDVHIYDTARDTLLTAATLDVHTGHEDGLLGVALDPGFARNNWVYLFYSPVGGEPRQHVSRFVLDGDRLDLGSEVVLLEIPVQRDECCHSAGSMEFDPDGNLFISVGDNTNPHQSDGYAPIDEREGRTPFDAQRSSANTNDLRGKILRIHPEDDGTYTIPAGNLFAGDDQHRPEIYTMGHRNPYRIAIDPETGWLYWGDVGPDAGNDSTGRGPRGHDEYNQAREAGNYGWPYFTGNNIVYHDYDFATGVSGAAFDPAAPVNDSPNNTGARNLPPAQPAMIWYPAGASELFPVLGAGGRSAMAGFVYHADAPGITDEGLPAYYDGKVFLMEWMRGMILAVTLDDDGGYARMERFLPNWKFNNPIDLKLASDGSVYMLEYGPLWFSGSPEAQLSRISYVAGNRTPDARIAVDRTVGGLPLTVAFSADQAEDPDGDDLSYAWTVDGAVVSSEAAFSHTFDRPGRFTVGLTVTDPEGESATAEQAILAGNALPELTLDLQGNRMFFWDGQAIEYAVAVADEEDGTVGSGIDPASVTVTIDYLPVGEDLVQPALGHQAMMEASQALIGKRLVEGGTCTACHQVDQASVGPAFVRVAEKYQGQDVVETLARKVMTGGGGVWGDIAMPAHPDLSPEEARKMVEYVLSLGEHGRAIKGLPLQGTYTFDGHRGQEGEGQYILMASYTDRGANGINPLTAREVVTLRPPRLPAWAFDESDGGQRFTVPADAPGGMGGQDILLAEHGAVVRYKDIDLTDIAGIAATFAVAPAYTTGGFADVYLGGPEGTRVGTFEVKQGLVDFGAQTVDLAFDPLNGVHDLVLVFRNEDEEGLVCIGLFLDFKHKNQAAL